MKTDFDYTKVPYFFGYCAIGTCPKRETCLRFLAWKYTPAEQPFLSLMDARYLEARGNHCQHYLPNTPVKYARGFLKLTKILPVAIADSFRRRMIAHFGRKVYYQIRKGERLIHPTEQQFIVELVERLGVEVADCFDAYQSDYDWNV